jgi:prephenate dehydrogenase (NADP+)
MFSCFYIFIRSSNMREKATKVGAIVGGQTSCKAPELAAFEKHLPSDVEIISCHSLHGPNINPKGQPLVGYP